MSIKKVAQMAGVSIATVSRYFSNPKLLKRETLIKVERASNALNYHPNTLAQNFRRGKSGLIVVVVYNIGDPIYDNFTRIITQIAQSKGYDILIKETNHNHLTIDYYRSMLSSKRADGLIVLVDIPKMNKENQLVLERLPIVFIKGEAVKNGCPSQYIGLDNFEAAKTATQHLIDLKHKNIACITTNNKNTSYISRKTGFTFALKKAKLSNEFVFTIDNGTHSTNNIDSIVQQLLSIKPKITAIFCTDDDIAIDTLSLLKREKINVPDEISIVGFNNIRYASKTNPPLTTVEQPFSEITQHAINLLCNKIEKSDHSPSIKTTFQHRLVTRSSTSNPSL